MYEVHLSQIAQRFLDKLNDNIKERVEKRLKMLKDNPVPSDSKFIKRENNEKIFRIRIGDLRALYKVKEEQKVILISKIDKRNKVYD
ncbi:MAG: type II toxin-antitoxin system RelE/ParE family toxin [Nanoarchaeota archaeon]